MVIQLWLKIYGGTLLLCAGKQYFNGGRTLPCILSCPRYKKPKMRDACMQICVFFVFGGNSPHMSFLTGQVHISERNPHVVGLENYLVGLSWRHAPDLFWRQLYPHVAVAIVDMWMSLHFWDKWACGKFPPKKRERSTDPHACIPHFGLSGTTY